MSATSSVVQQQPPHRVNRGGLTVDKPYDATYKLGNTTVHIVAPSISEEEKERRIASLNRVVWNIWTSLPVEKRIQINSEYEARKG